KNIPLIAASSENNGVVDFISQLGFISDKKVFEKKITIDMFWNVFYHDYKYFSDDNVHTLVPQFKTNKYISLFIVSILRKLNYKYSFGRQSRINRIEKEEIKLPVKNNQPDWEFMEKYIKSLPYSSSL
ncbi:MAG: restriction endonuclease subunit S, partial [bacterium]